MKKVEVKPFRAWEIAEAGKPLTLNPAHPPLRALAADELRILVKAISINPVDWKLVAHPLPMWTYPHIPGCDGSGLVVEVGEEKDPKFKFKINDRVAFHVALATDGTFAEFVIAKKCAVARIPAKISFEQGAALPCVGMTAYQAIQRKMHVSKGQWLLITGAAGGVGSMGVQVGKLLGAHVVAICDKSQSKYVTSLGAEVTIDYHDADWPAQVNKATGGGVDAVMECVSAEMATKCLGLLRFNGQLAHMAGAPDTSVIPPLTKAPSYHEMFLGGAYLSGEAAPVVELGRMLNELVALLEKKKLVVTIAETVPFDKLGEALDKVQAGKVKGKLVVTV